MNRLFVNIKVDREERPDLDKIYQFAHQVLTQRGGGWPLTMFLTHDDQKPFFGGTYFPDKARYGMPAFTTILERVAEYYHAQGEELRAQNDTLMEVFNELTPAPADAAMPLSAAPLDAARAQFASTFDRQYGGFGGAPKFPHPGSIDRLMHHWHASAATPSPDLHALFMATLTLTRMAEGGMYDQLGGGFARYSVDQYWMIPHFEKMLYDNGALLASYADAALATGDALFRRIANETGEWLLREMQDEGGVASIRPMTPIRKATRASSTCGRARKRRRRCRPRNGAYSRGASASTRRRISKAHGIRMCSRRWTNWRRNRISSRPRCSAGWTRRAPNYWRIRSRRVWPGLDDKILTSWNALAIRGLAIAARSLGKPGFGAAAARALEFLRANAWRNGRLLATSKDGVSHLNAYLDDYAYLADALLEMLQLRWRNDDVSWLREILDAMLAHFEDQALGGFFFTSDDHEALIHRTKSFSDDAIPAGNGIAARALIRAGYLLGEPRYLEAAERTLRAAWQAINRFPHGHVSLLEALDEYLAPPEIIIIRERTADGQWQRELDKLYAPHRMVFTIPADLDELARRRRRRQGAGGGDARLPVPRVDVFGAGGVVGGSAPHHAGQNLARLAPRCGRGALLPPAVLRRATCTDWRAQDTSASASSMMSAGTW